MPILGMEYEFLREKATEIMYAGSVPGNSRVRLYGRPVPAALLKQVADFKWINMGPSENFVAGHITMVHTDQLLIPVSLPILSAGPDSLPILDWRVVKCVLDKYWCPTVFRIASNGPGADVHVLLPGSAQVLRLEKPQFLNKVEIHPEFANQVTLFELGPGGYQEVKVTLPYSLIPDQERLPAYLRTTGDVI